MALPFLFKYKNMFIRFLTGRRAGQIAEMKFADAQPLLNDGRAERVQYENPVSVNSDEPTKQDVSVPSQSKKRGKQ